MSKRRTQRPALLVIGALVLLNTSACVDTFGGSSLEITLDPGVDTPTPVGQTPAFGRPPPNTYFAFYSVNYTFQTDDEGNVLVDAGGFPLVESTYAFEAQTFEVRSVINVNSPCFIMDDLDPYPGLHVTQVANKTREQTGITDPFNSPEGTPEGDITDVLTADKRVSLLPALQNDLRAVTNYEPALPPGAHPDFHIATECVEDNANVDPNLIPPATCIGPDSNARRYDLCEQYFDLYPNQYEGSDKVFAIPVNGKFRGFVTGVNPKNSGFVGGAHFLTEANLDDFDALLINWQYKDVNDDGEPDYPDGTIDADKSNIGFHYMEGTPVIKTRGVINVPLANRSFNLSGEAAIIPDLGNDTVQF